ncbi:hypothetical protein IU459_27100 [Nocardia amamiensis]|uniref:Uncharacterized protein n=1 Tax=Nocardia amamiensis TaxID=404578 RepID=A0ABS0D236_9NOCA|nr:hypothetical protein [Nocardia amamiensis]MBF6301184.1 hypothetical protein [Nocardia amamiensis]
MDLPTLANAAAEIVRAAVDSLLHHPIGHAPMLKAIPLRILMAVQW